MPEISHLFKSFDGKSVIEDFSLSFREGERICLMGASGCGKTTLLRLICGLEKPDSGEIRFPANTRFSMVFQEDRLLPAMSAMGNVKLVSDRSPKEIRSCLRDMGISETEAPVGTFSGGMKRRVALCRALLHDSDAILLDEPYKGLDEETRTRVIRECKKWIGTRTAILVTHDLREAGEWRIVALKE